MLIPPSPDANRLRLDVCGATEDAPLPGEGPSSEDAVTLRAMCCDGPFASSPSMPLERALDLRFFFLPTPDRGRLRSSGMME